MKKVKNTVLVYPDEPYLKIDKYKQNYSQVYFYVVENEQVHWFLVILKVLL